MGAARGILAVLLAGGAGFAWWRSRADAAARAQVAQQPQVVPVTARTGTSSGASPILQMLGGIVQLIDAGNSGPVTATASPGNATATIGGGSAPPSNSGGSTSSGGLTSLLGGLFGMTTGQGGASGGLAPLLNLIGGAEAPGGYNTVYAASRVQPPAPITTLTVQQVMAWQEESRNAGSVSTAAGRYQIILGTMRDLVSAGVLRRTELFNASAQDRAAEYLAERRGLSDYRSGQISAETFANNLAKEWAGLPVVSGQNAGRSYYDGYAGNSARATPAQVSQAIAQIS